MVEVDGATPLIGERGAVTLLDVFEGRRMLIAYYFMWHTGHPGAGAVRGVHLGIHRRSASCPIIHSRDVTYATFCQGPYEESVRYRDFMGWEMPWYSAQDSLDTLLVGRRVGMMHIVCYLRQGSNVFETYWTTRRGVEAMDNSYAVARPDRLRAAGDVGGLADRLATTVGRRAPYRTDGRPTAQWSRLKAGYSDDLGTGRR